MCTTPDKFAFALVVAGSSWFMGCSDDGPVDPPDASAADASAVDASALDAAPDAGGPCPGELVFTGAYEDWDSTLDDFMGIGSATVTHREDPSNTAQTAPNGRVIMCVTPGQDGTFDFEHPSYLDLRYRMSAAAQDMGPFAMHGLTPARLDDLFTLELGLTPDVAAGQVLVAVRRYPDDEPALGASVTVGNANAGAFTDDGTGFYGAGDQLGSDSFIFFANVEPGGGTTTVSVTPPAGYTCVGPDTIEVVPGALSATTFGCVQP